MNIIWSSKSQRTDDVVLPATEKVLPLNEVLTRLTTDGHSQQGCSTFPVDHMLLSRPVIQLLKRKFVKVSWLISWFKLLYIQCMIRLAIYRLLTVDICKYKLAWFCFKACVLLNMCQSQSLRAALSCIFCSNSPTVHLCSASPSST